MCEQGKEVIEHYINELMSEGMTYVPPWSETSVANAACRMPSSGGDGSDAQTGRAVFSVGEGLLSPDSENSLELGATANSLLKMAEMG